MVRTAFAAACCLAFLLAVNGTARAEPPCGGIVITDVKETAPGSFTAVGERCYERGPGAPFYYDAPGSLERPRDPDVGGVGTVGASVSTFDSAVVHALGVVNLEGLTDPFAGDRSRFIFRPDADPSD